MIAHRHWFVPLLLALFMSLTPAIGATFGPTPYLSLADSPFPGLDFGYFHVETFEDGLLNTPGVLLDGGYVVGAPGSATDSVDSDDGAIDGNGQGGYSLYSNNGQTAVHQFAFNFNASDLGDLPTHAGIVWTDVGTVLSGTNFSGQVVVEAFDAANASLGVIGPVLLGTDGNVNGGTAEDRFFGFSHLAGISRLTIAMPDSTDWEVDHLQYGRLVPEPRSTIVWLVTGFVSLYLATRKAVPLTYRSP